MARWNTLNRRMPFRLAFVLIGLASCSLSSTEAAVVVERSDITASDSAVPPNELDGRQDSIDPPTTVGPPTDSEAMTDDEIAELLDDLAANGFCDPADVEDEGVVSAMHFVVQGRLQAPCYVDQRGEGADVADVVLDDDPRLIAAWDLLAEVTPIELVDDISLFAGYEACSDCDTLAFVSQLDEAAAFVIMAVDVAAADADPEELRLTMLHELTHVFTQVPGEQLVVAPTGAGCATFFNGVGCFTADSYMWAWIEEFWPPEVRDTLPADGSVSTEEEAATRCDSDPAYTGSYGAVHPEEDFAETFSAYVFDVEVDSALTPKLDFFDRYPEFVEIRENARTAGYGGTEANFDGCG